MVLDAAGLINGKTITCYPDNKTQIRKTATTNDKLCVDGKIITSQGAGTAYEFALALVTALCGQEKAQQVANSICYDK